MISESNIKSEALFKYRSLIIDQDNPHLIYKYLICCLKITTDLENNAILLEIIDTLIKKFIDDSGPGIVSVLLFCARILVKMNKLNKARYLCFEILKRKNIDKKERIKAIGLLGDIYFRSGRTNKAIKKYAQAACAAKKMKFYDLAIIAYHQMGVVFIELDNLDIALEKLDAPIKLCKKIKKNYKLGESYFQKGRIYEQKEQWELALKAYYKALILKRDVEDNDHYNAEEIYKRVNIIHHKINDKDGDNVVLINQ